MISLSIINILGIVLLMFAIPIKYVTVSIMIMAVIGLGAGIVETVMSYKDKEEKEGQILIVGIISLAELLMATSIIEDYIKHANLNESNTLMYEFTTSMLKAPAGTEIIYQAGMFLGLVIIIGSLLGLLAKRG
jgi:hypothetical protein